MTVIMQAWMIRWKSISKTRAEVKVKGTGKNRPRDQYVMFWSSTGTTDATFDILTTVLQQKTVYIQHNCYDSMILCVCTSSLELKSTLHYVHLCTHSNTIAAEKLLARQHQMRPENNVVKVKNDVITRWNSTYDMFRCMCEIPELQFCKSQSEVWRATNGTLPENCAKFSNRLTDKGNE